MKNKKQKTKKIIIASLIVALVAGTAIFTQTDLLQGLTRFKEITPETKTFGKKAETETAEYPVPKDPIIGEVKETEDPIIDGADEEEETEYPPAPEYPTIDGAEEEEEEEEEYPVPEDPIFGEVEEDEEDDESQNTCTDTWTKALSGTYIYEQVFNEFGEISVNNAPFLGTNAAQIRNLAKKIQNGCDLKLQFETDPQGETYEPTINCNSVEILGDINTDLEELGENYFFHVACKSSIPLHEGGYDGNIFLFDQVSLSAYGIIGEGDNKQTISKRRVGITEEWIGMYHRSLFEHRAFDDDWRELALDRNQNWKVTAWVKR